jgi:plasmid stability protein
MAQLIVRKLEDKVVRKLKGRAAKYGVSMEEAHRRILRETLLKQGKPKVSFKEFLLMVPDFGDDLDSYRSKTKWLKVDLD